MGKRRRGRTVCAGAAPKFMPKGNSELIVNRGQIADDVARLEIWRKVGRAAGRA
jgi:hypothetical protein